MPRGLPSHAGRIARRRRGPSVAPPLAVARLFVVGTIVLVAATTAS